MATYKVEIELYDLPPNLPIKELDSAFFLALGGFLRTQWETRAQNVAIRSFTEVPEC